jgi:hypothetical protein
VRLRRALAQRLRQTGRIKGRRTELPRLPIGRRRECVSDIAISHTPSRQYRYIARPPARASEVIGATSCDHHPLRGSRLYDAQPRNRRSRHQRQSVCPRGRADSGVAPAAHPQADRGRRRTTEMAARRRRPPLSRLRGRGDAAPPGKLRQSAPPRSSRRPWRPRVAAARGERRTRAGMVSERTRWGYPRSSRL